MMSPIPNGGFGSASAAGSSAAAAASATPSLNTATGHFSSTVRTYSSSTTTKQLLQDFWKDDYAPLREAGEAVLRCLREDEAAGDADLYRRIANGSAGTTQPDELALTPGYYSTTTTTAATRMRDSHNQNSSATHTNSNQNTLSALAAVNPQWVHLKSLPLPTLLQEELRKTKSYSFMGLLSEASLCWMTVDEKLWLWTLDSSSSSTTSSSNEPFCSFQVPSGQPIVTTALVRPKQGVFASSVEWCVVVSAVDQILLCVLNRVDGMYRFIPTVYAVSTDVVVVSVVGTKNGRIFLGGDDGSIGEMTYQGEIEIETGAPLNGRVGGRYLEDVLHQFYDEAVDAIPSTLTVDSNHIIYPLQNSDTLQWIGKRTWSAMRGRNDTDHRKHKVAKISRPSSNQMLTSILPSFIANILGGGSDIGKIIQMKVDEHRQTLVTLSSKGFLTAHDLRRNDAWCRTDVPRILRSYLEAVARGQMYPPPGCSFPGGEAIAQTGIGNMEGARKILKAAEFGSSRHRNVEVLKPCSIHLISPTESQRLTVVAVTTGGLRLYLSSLASGVLAAGPNASTRHVSHPLSPSTWTLCYVRSPPPHFQAGLSEGENTAGYIDASYYHQGNFFAAFEQEENAISATDYNSNTPLPSAAGVMGNLIVATCPDATLRSVERKEIHSSKSNGIVAGTAIINAGVKKEQKLVLVSGGMSETVSLPMSLSAGILPGGIVWDISQLHAQLDPIEKLTYLSQTPTESELSVGIPPAYFPPSKVQETRLTSSTTKAGKAQNETLVPYGNASLSSTALKVLVNVVSNVIMARPLRRGLRYHGSRLNGGAGLSSSPNVNYRVSKRSATDGFSFTASESTRLGSKHRPSLSNNAISFTTPRSARLRPGLLKPSTVPLNQLSTVHLNRNDLIVALNAGGLHYFGRESILTKLADALLNVGGKAATDPTITNFFTKYSYKEGCAMCLALAIGCESSDENESRAELIRERATAAVLARAFVPRLVLSQSDTAQPGESVVSTPQTISGTLIPSGYEFMPSELSNGLFALYSRLVRPIWCKPLVVVTEGRIVHFSRSQGSKVTPAKVEILLCDASLNSTLGPLSNLFSFMKRVFSRAVKTVPGRSQNEDNAMDVDDHLLTSALDYKYQLRAVNEVSPHLLKPAEADAIARLLEEKNIHCLFRLLSRTFQLLKLVALLRRNQHYSDLNEVNWGLWHGLTVSQLVETSDGQERLESLLYSLVTGSVADDAVIAAPSAQADHFADQISTECYLFFSPGSRSAYLGFRTASDAFAYQQGSERRASLSARAADYLRSASKHWCNARLISGRLLHTDSHESVEQIALRARNGESPLARAVDILVRLGDVATAVEICLMTASNFKCQDSMALMPRMDESSIVVFSWEHNLYHKCRDDASSLVPKSSSPTSPTQLVAYGANVTSKDAIDTCYALVFYHLSALLKAMHPLRLNMVSVCASSTDGKFLDSLFRFLLENGHKDTLLCIDTKDLEDWLRNLNDPELLRSYYSVQERFAESGQVSWDVACDSNTNRPLAERIDWLYNALNAFESAKQYPTASGDVIHKANLVSDLLRIAKIQSELLAAVLSSKTDLPPDALDKLSNFLISASDLYNDYAGPLGLFEQCLFLLHACRQQEDQYITFNWKGVICEEILPCMTRSKDTLNFLHAFVADLNLKDSVRLVEEVDSAGSLPLFEDGNWTVTLEDRITCLGKELYGTGADYVFPVDSLLEFLHDLSSLSSSVEFQWPFIVLVKSGVSFQILLDSYEAFVLRSEVHDSYMDSSEERMKHLWCVVGLIEFWVACSGSQSFDGLDKARVELTTAITSGRLITTMTGLKTRLGLLTDSSSQALQNRIIDLEARLQRFV